MCHFLPLIAFTHSCVPCYGKIITTDVCRSMWKAFVFNGSRSAGPNGGPKGHVPPPPPRTNHQVYLAPKNPATAM